MRQHFGLVKALFGLGLLLLLAGCDRKLFFADTASVDEHGWQYYDTVPFEVAIADTNAIYNFFIDLRNSTNYPYANSFMFITTTFPDGSMAADTMELPLADPSGKWYGQRSGRYINNRYYFRKNVRFPLSGTYRFALHHGMRDSAIVGLKDVGIRIELAQ